MALQFHETFVTYAAETARMGSTKFIYHKLHYAYLYCSRVDSQTKCKFCTNTESCMEYEEWEPTTVT
jgi:hypothetical protein